MSLAFAVLRLAAPRRDALGSTVDAEGEGE